MTNKELQALAEFRYQLRCFLTFSEGVARSAGIQPQQHQLLLALRGLPKDMHPTVQNLAERLQVRHHTAVGLINRLAQRGLVGRKRSPTDKREVLIIIRPKGETLLNRLARAHRDELGSAGPQLIRTLKAVIR